MLPITWKRIRRSVGSLGLIFPALLSSCGDGVAPTLTSPEARASRHPNAIRIEVAGVPADGRRVRGQNAHRVVWLTPVMQGEAVDLSARQQALTR